MGANSSGSGLSYTADEVTLTQASNQFSLMQLGVTNTYVSTTAAIAYAKLNLTNSIVGGDLASGTLTSLSLSAALRGMEFISELNPSAATTAFFTITAAQRAQYDYFIVFANCQTDQTSGSPVLQYRVNADSSSNIYNRQVCSGTTLASGATTEIAFAGYTAASTTLRIASGIIMIPASTNVGSLPLCTFGCGGDAQSILSAIYRGSGTLTSIDFSISTGNIAGGNLQLFGVRAR